MRISELMEELEYFKEDFGDVDVFVSRNGRSYPVFIEVTGTYPGYTDRPNEHSGYFSYLDEGEAEEEGLTEKDTNMCVLND